MNSVLNKKLDVAGQDKSLEIKKSDSLNASTNFELKLSGIHIWHFSAGQNAFKPSSFNTRSSYIQMIFSLDNGGDQLHSDKDEILGIEENNLLFIPEGESGILDLISNHRELFGINIDSDLFLKFIAFERSIYDSIKGRLTSRKIISLNPHNRFLTTAMREVIHQIIRCMQRDHCRCIYYQAKVMELLSLQLEQVEYSKKSSIELKEEELRRIYKVRDILEQNPEKSFSLLGLAHAVGTNDATLKKHFKIVFGTTVFAYLNSFRMERAKEMLLIKDCKIALVANQFGYKHATHFSAAFKKYFGYPPTKIKI